MKAPAVSPDKRRKPNIQEKRGAERNSLEYRSPREDQLHPTRLGHPFRPLGRSSKERRSIPRPTGWYPRSTRRSEKWMTEVPPRSSPLARPSSHRTTAAQVRREGSRLAKTRTHRTNEWRCLRGENSRRRS